MDAYDVERLKFLQTLTPGQIIGNGWRDELLFLATLYNGELRKSHDNFVERIKAESKVHAALAFDYDEASNKFDTMLSKIVTPQHITIRECAQWLLLLQGWKDHIHVVYQTVVTHALVLDNAYDRIVEAWKAVTLTRIEWQAKSEALNRANDLLEIKSTSGIIKKKGDLAVQELNSKWNTFSRIAAISDRIMQAGDIEGPVVNYPGVAPSYRGGGD